MSPSLNGVMKMRKKHKSGLAAGIFILVSAAMALGIVRWFLRILGINGDGVFIPYFISRVIESIMGGIFLVAALLVLLLILGVDFSPIIGKISSVLKKNG